MITANLSKKILNVGPEYVPPQGGIAQVIYNYSQYIFPKNEFNYISNSCDGIRIKKICKLVLSMIGYFATLTFQHQIKIVHIHTASNFSFKRSSWFVSVAYLFHKRVILHVHGGGFKEYYADHADFVRKTFRKCDVIVALTDAWANWFRAEVGIDQLKVVLNVIPEPSPCFNKKRDDIFRLLFLGAINEPKGIFDLVNAIKMNKERLNGCFELHVGGNGQTERLQNFITANRLENLVKYEGWVDSSRKHDLLCGCDALVLPSYIEGLPLSILEAMSYQKLVISTPVGGIPSMIEDGVNGFLITPGDGQTFIDRIVYLIEHRSECITMGKASYNKINNHFPKSVAIVLMEIYNKLIM